MPIYLIQSGVRRAKAMLEAGHLALEAEVFGGGFRGQIMTIPIAELRSPRREFDASSSQSQRDRWQSIKAGVRNNPMALPPIIVTVISKNQGIPVKDVDVV